MNRVTTALELAGLAAIVFGAFSMFVPAGWVALGIALFLTGYWMEG